MGSARRQGHLNLVVAAINMLIDRSLITWSPIHLLPPEHGHIVVELAGQPSAIVWHDVGYGELSISVWWKFDYEVYSRLASSITNFATTRPAVSRAKYSQFVGATASIWFERKDGFLSRGRPPGCSTSTPEKALRRSFQNSPGKSLAGSRYPAITTCRAASLIGPRSPKAGTTGPACRSRPRVYAYRGRAWGAVGQGAWPGYHHSPCRSWTSVCPPPRWLRQLALLPGRVAQHPPPVATKSGGPAGGPVGAAKYPKLAIVGEGTSRLPRPY